MRIIDTGLLDQARMNSLSQTDKDWIYNGLDCCLTLEIDEVLDQYMDPVSEHMYNISRALQAPILEMNMRGILIDIDERDKAIAGLKSDMARVDFHFDRLCSNIFGQLVNPASPKQVIDLFYNWLSIPEQRKRNAKGEWVPTVDRDTLEKLAKNYSTAKPFVSHILRSRDISKQISSLETPLSESGRFHTSLSIAGTKTGRLASALSDFNDGSNLQNIDRRIKKMFIADPGKKFCNVDLEQADARNVGAQTWNLFPEYGDASRFLDAAESGDLHTFVCSMCWTDLPWTDDPRANRALADQPAYREKSYRDLAKILGHGTNFNGQAPQMAMHTKVERAFIEDFQYRYFSAFPEVKRRIEWIGEKLVEDGNLVTLFGRRRFFLKRRGDNKTLNEGCAFDPQSMTADEINYAMIRVYQYLKPVYPWLELLIQVHDSLLFQYPEEYEDLIVPLILKCMQTILTLRNGRKFYVPSEAKVGWNWGDYASQEDSDKAAAKGKRVDPNLNGMKKYKGTDTRVRL
jgi:DNA polymerase I